MEEEDVSNLIGCVMGFAFAGALLIYCPFTFGVVFMCLWRWFILPVFDGAPDLSLPQCIGIGFVLQVVRGTHHSLKKQVGETTNWTALVLTLLWPWIILFCGFIFMVIFC